MIEQELLALLLTLQRFDVYLPAHGLVTKVYSDHYPLQFLRKFNFKNQRLTWWSLLLHEYNLHIHHIRGLNNVFADRLSRAEVPDQDHQKILCCGKNFLLGGTTSERNRPKPM